MIEAWKQVWREGIAPVLPAEGLIALRNALESDDRRLMQGCTTQPPPLSVIRTWKCEGGCAISYAGWLGESLVRVHEVASFFDRVTGEAAARLERLAGDRGEQPFLSVGMFLNWFDDTPRNEVRRELLPEVVLALESRRLPQRAA
jgi:hypothetical protein